MMIYNLDTRTTVELILLDDNGHDWLKKASQADDSIIPMDKLESQHRGTQAQFKAITEDINWWANLCDMQKQIYRFKHSRCATREQLQILEKLAGDAWDLHHCYTTQIHKINEWKSRKVS